MTASKLITKQEQALETLGGFLRHERDACGYSQLSVATHAGVSQPLYAGIEGGNRPLPIHRAADFGDTVVVGAIKFLLTQLNSVRLELVQASDERVCAESYATLASLVSKSSHVCQVMAAALEDGVVTDDELDALEDKAAEAEETFRRLRRDIAVKRAVRQQARKVAGSVVNTRTGSGIQAKAGGAR